MIKRKEKDSENFSRMFYRVLEKNQILPIKGKMFEINNVQQAFDITKETINNSNLLTLNLIDGYNLQHITDVFMENETTFTFNATSNVVFNFKKCWFAYLTTKLSHQF